MEKKYLETDVLIIGGGTAGCFAAYTLGKQGARQRNREQSSSDEHAPGHVRVLIAEKANIKRSGCLAAGVNAINAYITEGCTPQFYVDYCMNDADGIAREDLLLSMSERLNHVTEVMESLGLVILKDENGKYVTRGKRNIKINGENIKPILARAAQEQENVSVLNHVNITDYIVSDNRIYGAVGFDVDRPVAYVIRAKAVLIATGGASGLYRPNNPGFSRHKMWYSPFNTGAGYAMGIRAGAEMTTFEMRFIALRCKDTIAPTGTIAQGVGAKQVNSRGRIYENEYGLRTSERVYGTTEENRRGHGPCYLKTDEITPEQEQELYKAYLNMAPSQTLRWLEGGQGPSEQNVEIEGTEPYIVGGHTASGYWIGDDRATTIEGLFAAGDVAGGAPQKYVTGALAEGEIAAESMLDYLWGLSPEMESEQRYGTRNADETDMARHVMEEGLPKFEGEAAKSGMELERIIGRESDERLAEYERYLGNPDSLLSIEQVEETMQKIMDGYAGGIGSDYIYNEAGLTLAREKILLLQQTAERLAAHDMDELLQIYEIRERLVVCLTLIEHLLARKETRWHSFAENADHPQKSEEFECYINSRVVDGKIQILKRDLVRI